MTNPLGGTHQLEAGAVDAFRRDGHVLVRGLSDAEELAPYKTAIEGGVEAATADRLPLEERDTYHQAFLQVPNMWRHHETIADFVLAPRFARVAAALMGVPAVRLYHDQALFKEPGGGYTPWHQDAMYWPLDGSRCVTMWMPLVDAAPEMGTLVFASGTASQGPLSDVTISDASEAHFDTLLAGSEFTVTEPNDMRAGDATFHAGWTVHRAPRNESDRGRSVMTVIWFADGLEVLEPTNPAQERDLATWLPGLRPGDLAASELNPRIG